MKLSVIIPVYNVEPYLTKCINSVINQTYKDLEIILINDGSTDNSGVICDKFARIDPRIYVIHQKNKGVSYARNKGLKIASGNYVTFVDADDYIAPNMYKDLLSAIDKYQVQIAHCSYTNIEIDGNVVPVGDTGKIIVQSHDEALSYLIQGRMFAGGNCNKIYLRELLNGVFFDINIKINEDVWFCFQLFDRATSSVYIDRAYYYYVKNADSTTHTVSSLLFHEQVTEVARRIQITSKGKSYSELANNKLAYALLDLYRTFLLQGIKTTKKIALRNEVKNYKGYYKSKKLKLTYVLAMYFPHICTFTYKIYDRVRVKKLDPEQ